MRLFQASGRPPNFPFASPTEGFSPRQIGGLEYWFDARDPGSLFQDNALATPVTANGQPVGGWKDKANGRNLVQSLGTSKPTYRSSHINGRPAVDSDGVDDWIRYSGATLSQPLTVYFVGKLAVTAALQRWFDSALTNQVSTFVTAGGIRRIAAPTTIDAGAASTSPQLHTSVFNSLTSAYYVDGALLGGVADAGANSMDGLTLFAARGAGANCLSGAIGEFLAYSGAHSASQRQLVELYLKQRWGL